MKKIMVLFVVILLITSVCGCGAFVSKEKVAKAVEKQGYREVNVTSKHIFFVDWRGCSDSDDAMFNANTINSLDKRVDITICAGWPFKGVTVRTK